MDATEMKQLSEAIGALSEAKQRDLRKPVPLHGLTSQELRKLRRQCVAAAEADMPDAYLLVRAFLLKEMTEYVYGGASGLEDKLHRYARSLKRKLT